MIEVPRQDESLKSLDGAIVTSSVYADVTYRLERLLGKGSMAVAFLAERSSPSGFAPAVIKVSRPEFVREAPDTALLTIRKEAVALGRLNESVPPTPFVVRFIENGELTVSYTGKALILPWLAMEYVHGNTLEDRILQAVRETGAAFDPDRASMCVESIAQGLEAVHAVDVIHRDIKPNNVLCCGAYPDEAFKLSDFGVARPVGLKQTFIQGSMGTPGYASPEQILMDQERIGSASDVFSFAATAFSVLTGQDLFQARTVMEIVKQSQERKRRSVRDSPYLCEELRARPTACAAIDSAIAHATAPDARDRPQSAGFFGAVIASALNPESVRHTVGPVSLRAAQKSQTRASMHPSGSWKWKIRHATGDDRAIRSVAWDAAGSCLAATTSGLAFWNGTDWAPAPLDAELERRLAFVHHVGPGLWLLGGRDGMLAYYSSGESPQRVRRPRENIAFQAANGLPDDLAVVIGSDGSSAPLLCGATGKRWLKPQPLEEASFLLGLTRFEEERWLVVGRSPAGTAYAGLYAPLRWEVESLRVPEVRSFTACDAIPEMGVGIIVGAQGQAVRLGASGISASTVPDGPDLSTVVLEVNQRAWATSLGRIWMQTPQRADSWELAWRDDDLRVPIVGLFADGRRVIGVAADGAVVEGSEY